MSLPSQTASNTGSSFPRSRGDEPQYDESYVRNVQFSPLTRG